MLKRVLTFLEGLIRTAPGNLYPPGAIHRDSNNTSLLKISPALLFATILIFAPVIAAQVWEDSSPVSLRGEIVDSKCMTGAMTPGDGKSHRVCAIDCIKRGIPPLLKVLNRNGDGYRFYLLVGEGKSPANELVLPYVGDAVVVEGTLLRNSNVVILVVSSIRRVDGEKVESGN